ncbi:unnamed protein product [Durusdinium trenchii]|uniref:Uncharacterized protein n=1 Tax=Durusdinium trenchii TaxID=1381693 RepID=A0ABP0M8V6_9DINO
MIAFWARVDAPASKTMRPADRVLMARSSTEGGVAAQYPGVWLCGYGLADRTRARVETPRGVSVLAAAGEPEPNPWELLKSFGEGLFPGDFQLRQEEAARLLSSAALKQLGRWFQPAGERLSSETSDNVDEALDALLDEAKEHIVDFLSDRASPGPVSRVFWQAELYLRNFQQVAGEAPVEEFQQRAKVVEEEVAPEGSQMEAALGVVLARQQFVAASRFGYFLRRCQQRLRLERIMCFGCPVGTLGMQSGSKHAKCSKVKSNHAQSSMASKVPCFISHQHLEVPNC